VKPVFEVRGLSKSFGGVVVADDISLALCAGDRVAMIGPNGAGKTTFVDMVSGLVKPGSGTLALDGRDITHAKSVERVGRGLVRTFQVTRLFHGMTVMEHVLLAILHREKKTRRTLMNLSKASGLLAEARERLGSLHLLKAAGQPVAEIPYGQQRLLEIAIALSLDPVVLFLDEPAAGVPLSEIALIEQAIDRLPAQIAVLMIEHDMDFVFRFAKRVVVLAAGKVICDGTPAEVTAAPRVREAYLGTYTRGGADA
jgi:branched-chain amino acid transport system ATP-binding protein